MTRLYTVAIMTVHSGLRSPTDYGVVKADSVGVDVPLFPNQCRFAVQPTGPDNSIRYATCASG
jgi:hypothetical protein